MTGCDLRIRFLAAALFSASSLVACGGGGGATSGGGTPPTQAPTATPTSTASSGPSTTNASGAVVSDTTGLPLSGESVSLEPWVGGATPMPSPVATTNAQGQFTLANVPNGHYLLVIGSNSTSDTTYATVHDNVTLTGGNQTLRAPTLPVVPTITQPVWETNGDYRIAAIDQTLQLPCLAAFNADRVTATLSQVVEDEWLLENVRNMNNYIATFTAGSPEWELPKIETPLATFNGGTSTCSIAISPAFAPGNSGGPLTANVQWFAGQYQTDANNGSTGLAAFPADPRVDIDPIGPWP